MTSSEKPKDDTIQVLQKADARQKETYGGCAFHPYGQKVGLQSYNVAIGTVGNLILCEDCLQGMKALFDRSEAKQE